MTTAVMCLPAPECARVGLALAALRAAIGPIPPAWLRLPPADNPAAPAGRFDANRFFGVFDRLAVAPGHTLDYVYNFSGNAGRPLLYTRRTGARPLATRAEHEQHASRVRSRPAFLDQVQLAAGDPVAALHLAWFALEAPKFYLHWHAQYFDDELVVLPGQLKALLARIPASASDPLEARRVIAEPARAALRALDLQPRVAFGPDDASGEVTALAFGQWQGFHWRRTRFRRERSWLRRDALIIEHSVKVVAPYHCGIIF
ncbi:MAG: hypothetical protein Q7S40_01025 [Opitutaceae bacterium]|nr:hypothetical protein [Opitutaceae bacterium]